MAASHSLQVQKLRELVLVKRSLLVQERNKSQHSRTLERLDWFKSNTVKKHS